MFQQASKRALVSNAYCERKRNHSYPPSQGLQALEFFLNHQRKEITIAGEHQRATPHRATVLACTGTLEKAWCNLATSAQLFGFWESKSMS